MRRLLYLIFYALIISRIFIQFPKIDIIFSSIFLSINEHKFCLKNNSVLTFLSESAYYLIFCLLLYCTTIGIVKFFKKKVFVYEAIFILTFFVGSVLIVQLLSKYYFGRARPYNIIEFGGNKIFTPAYIISDQCKFNCSFVSFHASISTMMFIFCFKKTNRIKKIVVILFLLLSIIFSLIRIMQGRHFLSDIIISSCIMTIIYHFILLYYTPPY